MEKRERERGGKKQVEVDSTQDMDRYPLPTNHNSLIIEALYLRLILYYNLLYITSNYFPPGRFYTVSMSIEKNRKKKEKHPVLGKILQKAAPKSIAGGNHMKLRLIQINCD